MTGPCFVDANVLVYARDARVASKRARAEQWIAHLWQEHAGRTSIQVLSEYYAVATRKLTPRVPAGEAWEDVEELFSWQPQPVDAALLKRAHEIEQRWRLSWRDSMIVGAAKLPPPARPAEAVTRRVFHALGAAPLPAGAGFERSSPRLLNRRYSSRQAQASVAAYAICAAESSRAAQFEVLVPLGIRNERSIPARLRTPLWPRPLERARSPRSSMFFSANANTRFSARRSSASDTPALTVRGSERSPARTGKTSGRRSWNRYTARAVATCTRHGR